MERTRKEVVVDAVTKWMMGMTVIVVAILMLHIVGTVVHEYWPGARDVDTVVTGFYALATGILSAFMAVFIPWWVGKACS